MQNALFIPLKQGKWALIMKIFQKMVDINIGGCYYTYELQLQEGKKQC